MSIAKRLRKQIRQQAELLQKIARFDNQGPKIIVLATIPAVILFMFWESPLILLLYAGLLIAIAWWFWIRS